jgi:creatinine amidohydrolase
MRSPMQPLSTMTTALNVRQRTGLAATLPVILLAILLVMLITRAAPAVAGEPGASLQIEDMTSTELRDRIKAGATTILVPIGGTEQNGPYMVLGKHNVRARVLAQQIAQRLGNAVVAPVIAYVPEGSIDPPAAHMRFTGTISIPVAAFEAVLEGAARSFRQHGFREVVFLGDHGGYQRSLENVALKLNREWAAHPACRVHALLDYYRVTDTAYVAALKARGYSTDAIGTHAGLADTSLALAVDPALVRTQAMARGPQPTARDGVYGDPRKATVELGQVGVDEIVTTSVAQIRALTGAH